MSFDTTKTSLKELLGQVHEGKLQLPEFQRDYVWNEGDVRSLLESIAKGFPVGALLTLERGGSIEFKPRGIEGATVAHVTPEHLLLDGQQRMTSLYKTIYSKDPARVRTAKGQVVERFFYLSIPGALEPMADVEAAIELVPPDRVRRTNFGKFGEYQADVSLGQKRALIQWRRLTRPDGAIIDLDSPSADPLGRVGVRGKVNTHFFARFGGAILQSMLDLGVRAATREAAGDTVVVALPGTAAQLGSATTIGHPEDIKPTLKIRQGASVSVFVARDLDFTEVGG